MRPAKNLFVSYLGLFTAFGTLLCCALPSLLVALGMGATVAGFIGVFPQVVVLSEHKNWVFGISLALIVLAVAALYLQRNAPCPIDPLEARACTVARWWSVRIVVLAALFWSVGFMVAFVLPVLMS